MDRMKGSTMSSDRTRSEDFDEESPGGWDALGDEEAAERNAEDAETGMLLTDAALRPTTPSPAKPHVAAPIPTCPWTMTEARSRDEHDRQ